MTQPQSLHSLAMSDEKASFKPNTSSRYGIIAQGDDYIKLSGVSNEDIFKLQQAGANDTTTHRDASGLIIATEDISAVYEPGPQVCRLTSRLYACKGYEAIYEGHSKSTSVGVTGGVELSGGANVAGGIAGANGKLGANGGVSVGTSSSSTTHSGTFCNSFAEPLISEQIINFKTGEAVFGNIDRGNMESTYYNSSQTNTYTDNSWGVDASLSLSFDQSTHETNYGVEEGEIQYSNSIEETECKNKGEDYIWTGSSCRPLTKAEKRQREKELNAKGQTECKMRSDAADYYWNGSQCVLNQKGCKKDTTKEWKGGKCVNKTLTKKEQQEYIQKTQAENAVKARELSAKLDAETPPVSSLESTERKYQTLQSQRMEMYEDKRKQCEAQGKPKEYRYDSSNDVCIKVADLNQSDDRVFNKYGEADNLNIAPYDMP